jgi:hypothetical protein
LRASAVQADRTEFPSKHLVKDEPLVTIPKCDAKTKKNIGGIR